MAKQIISNETKEMIISTIKKIVTVELDVAIMSNIVVVEDTCTLAIANNIDVLAVNWDCEAAVEDTIKIRKELKYKLGL